MSFEQAHGFVKPWEGGLVDHPHDPGGITKWGVAIRTLVAKGLDLNGDGTINRRDILDMTEEQAERIFRGYWDRAKCASLPEPLAVVHYDCAVNQGVGRASRILQKAVGAKVDGIIGPRTLEATRASWRRRRAGLLGEYCARRAVHYSSLANVVRFGLGWFRRLFDCQRFALELHHRQRH